MAIASARLHRRITLQQRSSALDGVGNQDTTWTDVAPVWADVQPLNGRELVAAQAVNSSVTHQILIRYQTQFADPKVMAAMRAVMTKDGITRIFNIHASRDEDERRRYLILDAEEGMNDG